LWHKWEDVSHCLIPTRAVSLEPTKEWVLLECGSVKLVLLYLESDSELGAIVPCVIHTHNLRQLSCGNACNVHMLSPHCMIERIRLTMIGVYITPVVVVGNGIHNAVYFV
jgi:hypothetical protein